MKGRQEIQLRMPVWIGGDGKDIKEIGSRGERNYILREMHRLIGSIASDEFHWTSTIAVPYIILKGMG